MKAYFFGCVERVGHFLWEPNLHGFIEPGKTPWANDIDDGKYMPEGIDPYSKKPSHTYAKHGQERLHHKMGWTALVIADNSVDSRPNSKAAFIFDKEVDIEKARELAKEHFPSIVARIEAHKKTDNVL